MSSSLKVGDKIIFLSEEQETSFLTLQSIEKKERGMCLVTFEEKEDEFLLSEKTLKRAKISNTLM